MASRKRWAIGTVGFLLVAAAVVLGVLGGLGYFSKKKGKYSSGQGGEPCYMSTPIGFGTDPDNKTITFDKVEIDAYCNPIPTVGNVTATLSGDINMNLTITSVAQSWTGGVAYMMSAIGDGSSIKPKPGGYYCTFTVTVAGQDAGSMPVVLGSF